MRALRQPAGEVTLVFSDIEGSTRLLAALGTEAYREALAEHRRVIRQAYARYAGYEVDYEGDAFFYAFYSARDALSAVSEAIAALEGGPIRVRVGIHTGRPGLDPPKYVGMDVHVAARVMGSAHGGQVVLSKATADLVEQPLTELGEHRLKDIAGTVSLYQLGEGSFPPLKTISNTNLPRPGSSFVGRERELSEVLALIEGGARLLTLTGPGGSGKTRLALEVAPSLVPDYKAGIFWVDLAALRDPSFVIETIAQTLGAKDGLAEHLGEREMLLVIDNFEHVIEAAPELSSLLRSCPNLTLLVTSRELLRVLGEVEYPVPPLAGVEAVSLFCERAQTEASEEVADLCRRLDSLPLAVELAAARSKAMSPAQILKRLSGRLDLLKGGRDAEPRQQTLRATIEWSYDLLSSDEQELFCRLAVFAGGCTLEAAEEVCGADVDVLQSLVEKSLLRFSDERYWMLETIREYAAERLQATNAEPERLPHALYYLGRAEAADRLLTSGQQSALETFEAERANLRQAFAALKGSNRTTEALRLATALGLNWYIRGEFAEGTKTLTEAVGADAQHSRVRAKALHRLSVLLDGVGRYDDAEAAARTSVGIYRELGGADLYRALNNLANVLLNLGRYDDSEALHQEALRLARSGDDRRHVTSSLNNLAMVALTRREAERAYALASDAALEARTCDDRHMLCIVLHTLGRSASLVGETAFAAACFREGLELARQMGAVELVAYHLTGVAGVCASTSPAVAAEILGSALSLLDQCGAVLARDDATFVEAVRHDIEARLGRELSGGDAPDRRADFERSIERALASLD